MILLLEPDQILGKIYFQALQSAGHRVVWCRDAQSAIHEIDKDSPKLIIAELQLANHNGIEFLYELRSYQDWQKIPAIILSQVPSAAAGHEAWEQLNIVAYLYKPLAKLRDLIDIVSQVLVE